MKNIGHKQNKFFGMKYNLPFGILFVIILLFRALYYSQMIFVTYTNDSPGYMEHSLWQVVTGMWPRTPVYPFINAFAKMLAGESAPCFVVVLQIIVWC